MVMKGPFFKWSLFKWRIEPFIFREAPNSSLGPLEGYLPEILIGVNCLLGYYYLQHLENERLESSKNWLVCSLFQRSHLFQGPSLLEIPFVRFRNCRMGNVPFPKGLFGLRGVYTYGNFFVYLPYSFLMVPWWSLDFPSLPSCRKAIIHPWN